MTPRSESDVSRLRVLAHRIAERREERVATPHLLAAVFRLGGPAREILAARRLDEAVLLKGSRAHEEREGDVDEVLRQARDIARRAAVPAPAPGLPAAPTGVHVLVAIVSRRSHAAYRILVQLGVDVARLRVAATQVALGVVQPPRSSRPAAVEGPVATRTARAASRSPRSESRARPQEPRPRRRRPPADAERPEERRPRPLTRRGAVRVPLIPPLERKHVARHRGRPAEAVPSPPAVSARPPESARGTPSMTVARPRAPSPPPEAGASEGAAAILRACTRDLSALAAEGGLDEVVAREREVELCLDVLAKRHANCALLVGEAGVGKTTIARGLAARWVARPEAPSPRLLELRTPDLLAGTGARGALSERFGQLRRAIVAMEDPAGVLFVDDIHMILDNEEFVSELKEAVAEGTMPLVATTSRARFAADIESEPSLARLFTVVDVEAPSREDAFLMLRRVADDLGRHHQVTYADEVVALAVHWSLRFLPGRALPDQAVGLLDLAGARWRRRRKGTSGTAPSEVSAEAVADVVAERADVPVARLLETDQDRMLKLDRTLADRVVGHAEATARIAAVLRRNAAGLRGRRPIGTFLLLGPTGVGKTETAKALAEALFGDAEAMVRLDMSEYAESHAIARLLGAPPGYVGHEAGGLLTEAVRRRPYQVVLLDEIEKAHRDVLTAFLSVFDEGRLTDGRGRTVDFCETVIMLTSNLGAAEMGDAMHARPVGFGRRGRARAAAEGADGDGLEAVAVGAARARLSPELYNRLDEVLFFRPLERRDVREVARRLLAQLARSLDARRIQLDVDPAALDALLDEGGYDVTLGARPMRRAIARLVEVPLADLMLRREVVDGGTVRVATADGRVVVSAVGTAA
ncbi:MAG: ATP-dependent Clp protease ATP-binding subunit [Myxococcota bacterium]